MTNISNDIIKLITQLPAEKRTALAALLLRSKDAAFRPEHNDRIAIIGIGCRFPGNVNDPESYWNLLRRGVDAITEIPSDRWDVDTYYDSDPEAQGRMRTRWGGFLRDTDKFDAQFFGISPREAVTMDPQQRLLLEVAWEALEDAGQAVEKLAETKTGVFVGININDYGQYKLGSELLSVYSATGNALALAANRLSYILNLRGPSIAIDTACSSSLVATHLACQSLLTRESTLALVGGVNLILSPENTIRLNKFMSPQGSCKTFDAGADGYVRGEGSCVVVLKLLSAAQVDGDRIYAVIRGSAVNHDGRSSGLTVPSGRAQQALIRDALSAAGVKPAQISYVEAHGTGTSLGDPIEANALGAVLANDRPAGSHCAIGSVKTNIGHLEAVAGLAGLTKVALSLKHRMLPASLHFNEPNPEILFKELPLRVQQSLAPWPEAGGSRIAGVSSFGFGGTNAHVIVEEAPAEDASEEAGKEETEKNYLLPLSARSAGAVRELAERYLKYLESKDEETPARLVDICYTAGARRSHHQHRLCVAANSLVQLRERLSAYVDERSSAGIYEGRASENRPPVGFVFSGQGSQWVGMGQELLKSDEVFRGKVAECAEAMGPYLEWSVMEMLLREAKGGELGAIEQMRMRETRVAQPLLFAMQVGLAAVWRSWGVEPDAVVGHSMGEVAAACVSGGLSLAEGARVICLRGQAMAAGHGRGGMAAVELSVGEVEKLEWLRGKELRVAAENGPE